MEKNKVTYLAHLPTFLLLIGYPVFWMEFAGLSRNGVTTPLATILWIVLTALVAWKARAPINAFFKEGLGFIGRQPFFDRLWFVAGIILMGVFLSVGSYAASLPLHLPQENDALNYHYALVRQHLITHSFAHILWSHADLFLLPLNFALAPFWFVTTLPNKIPQFIFFVGIGVVGLRLLQTLSARREVFFVFVLCLLGSHNLGIQLGTAMLDVVILYLFLAFADSLFRGNLWLAAAELTFYFWAKPFIPLQTVAIGVVIAAGFFIFKQWRDLPWWAGLRKVFMAFAFLSIFVAGPFIAKSMVYAGTPLYPFAPGLIKVNDRIDNSSAHWQSIVASAKENIRCGKENYGYGRGPIDFLKHLWLIAVPDEGVNNKFDYPIGLVYLLVVGPFLFYAFKDLLTRHVSLLAVLIGLFWGSWWFGSLQTRFLYIPIVLMIIFVLMRLKNISVVFRWIVLAAVVFNALSVVRAHKPDFFQSRYDVLRAKDKAVVEFNKQYLAAGRTDKVVSDFHDAPFAQFPYAVQKQNLPYVIQMPQEE